MEDRSEPGSRLITVHSRLGFLAHIYFKLNHDTAEAVSTTRYWFARLEPSSRAAAAISRAGQEADSGNDGEKRHGTNVNSSMFQNNICFVVQVVCSSVKHRRPSLRSNRNVSLI